MSRDRTVAIVLAALVAVGAGAYLLYDNVLRGDAVAPLALPSASPGPAASTAPGAGGASASPSAAAVASPAAAGTDGPGTDAGAGAEVAGSWMVVEGSEAGYRIREQFASLPAETDAVGRTSDVSGSVTLVVAGDGAQVTEGLITVDTTTIASDEGRRDARMRTEGLQTDLFPAATFEITQPVDIPADALDGGVVDLTLVGDLTLHGVTRAVEIPVQAQLVDGQIRLAGSLAVTLADYDIVAPNVGGFIVSIADEGALEFLLVLAKA